MPNVQNANDFIVTPQRFSRLVEDAGVLKDTSTIAVAVSGGPDSMALLTMLAEWVGNRGVTLNALTVDHGLRSESAREAAQVAGWCGKLGIAHTILPWLGEKPGSGIQEGFCDCNGNTLDECGTCDDDPTNDCVEDCNGEFGGDATLDNCGTCDNDPTND